MAIFRQDGRNSAFSRCKTDLLTDMAVVPPDGGEQRSHAGTNLALYCHYCLRDKAAVFLNDVRVHLPSPVTLRAPRRLSVLVGLQRYFGRGCDALNRWFVDLVSQLMFTRPFFSELLIYSITATSASVFSGEACSPSGKPEDTACSGKAPRWRQGYHCDLCPYHSRNRTSYKRHMLTHSGERSFGCPVCSRKFALFQTLTDHMRTHSGEKPYQCPMCSYRAGNSSALADHKKRHTTDKLISCSVCPYVTVRRTNFKRHVMTHTGEKPYRCEECPYACSQKVHLSVHMLKHTQARLAT
nr:zinc finger protein 513-like [Dermacentor andersoni]